jgi:hypothetical protein
MEDKIDLILNVLREAAQVEFSRLLAGLQGIGAKMHAVMTLLASLELTRRRRLFLRQVRPFSELWLYRRESDPEGEAVAEVDAEATEEPELRRGEDSPLAMGGNGSATGPDDSSSTDEDDEWLEMSWDDDPKEEN